MNNHPTTKLVGRLASEGVRVNEQGLLFGEARQVSVFDLAPSFYAAETWPPREIGAIGRKNINPVPTMEQIVPALFKTTPV